MPPLSGQVTLPNAGAVVRLGSSSVNAPLMVKAFDDNSAAVFLGNDGNNSLSAGSGYPLLPGQAVTFSYVGDLGDLYLVAAANNQKVAWLVLAA